SFLLFWPSLISHREKSVLAVHRCTAGNPEKGYAEDAGTFFKQKETKAAKNLFSSSEGTSLFSSLSFVRRSMFRQTAETNTRAGCAPQTLFGREGGDDFFEARVAAQRIPVRIETQVAVGCASRHFRENFELLKSKVPLPRHSANHRKAIKRVPTIEGVFCDGQKCDCLTGLADRLFLLPKISVDQTQGTKRQTGIRLRPHEFFLPYPGARNGGESRAGTS